VQVDQVGQALTDPGLNSPKEHAQTFTCGPTYVLTTATVTLAAPASRRLCSLPKLSPRKNARGCRGCRALRSLGS